MLPKLAWTADDLARLGNFAWPTVLAALDMCAERPGVWIPLREIEERSGRNRNQARSDLAELRRRVKREFGRSNWPFVARWAAGGEKQLYYGLDPPLATAWPALSRTRASGVFRAVVLDPGAPVSGSASAQ